MLRPRSSSSDSSKSFTDVFIRHPVLAIVVNVAILIVG